MPWLPLPTPHNSNAIINVPDFQPMELVFGMIVMITITVTTHLLITIINIVMATLEALCQEIVACGVIMTPAAVGSSVMMI
jgi:hypothetical protein